MKGIQAYQPMIPGARSVTGHCVRPEKRSSPITVRSCTSRRSATPSTRNRFGPSRRSVARLGVELAYQIAVVGNAGLIPLTSFREQTMRFGNTFP